MTNFSATPQLAVLVALDAGPQIASRTPQTHILVALDETLKADITATPQLHALVAWEKSGEADVTRTPQLNLLYAYNEGARENNKLRAWSFVLDGNTFYVLHLGMLGTYVCNVTQGAQWSKWETQGMDNWNADLGLMWANRIVASDNQNPTLWIIDPEAENDEDDAKPIVRVATVNIPARGRGGYSIGMFSINAAAGYPSADGAELTLRFSDDNGVTWFELEPVVFEAGAFDQNLQFGSLGTFGQPGRIIEVSDTGGTMRLSDIDAEFLPNDPWGND